MFSAFRSFCSEEAQHLTVNVVFVGSIPNRSNESFSFLRSNNKTPTEFRHTISLENWASREGRSVLSLPASSDYPAVCEIIIQNRKFNSEAHLVSEAFYTYIGKGEGDLLTKYLRHFKSNNLF